MKESFKNDLSIIDFIPVVFSKWKKIILFSVIGAILFFAGSYYFFSDKYYTETIIVGEFSETVETKYGDYSFSSNNLVDYFNNIFDDRILEKTLDELNVIENKDAVKLEFKTKGGKDQVSVQLGASTNLEGFPLKDFLNSYFDNFISFLNITFYQNFLKEILINNSMIFDKLKNDISRTTREIEAYTEISDSINEFYNTTTGITKQAFFSSETLTDIDLLTTYSSLIKKKLELSLMKVELDNIQYINDNVNEELNKFKSNKNDFNFDIESIPLFNQRMRMISNPSNLELRSTNKTTIIFIGAFIGFLIALISLLATEFKSK